MPSSSSGDRYQLHRTSYTAPARRHVVRERASLTRRRQQPRLAEVGELQHTPRADEQVARLQVAVQHVRGVDGVHAAQDLVETVSEGRGWGLGLGLGLGSGWGQGWG